jgi:hypothetical protein
MRNSGLTVEAVRLAFETVGAEAWAAADKYKKNPMHSLMGNSAVTVEAVGLALEKVGTEV